MDAKRAWLKRVLGYDLPEAVSFTPEPPAPSLDELELRPRLVNAQAWIKRTADAGPELLDALAAADAAVTNGTADAPMRVDTLEALVSRGRSAALAADAQAVSTGAVAYSKLMLRWRDAQASVERQVEKLGAELLRHSDIQNDPRLDDIREVIEELPNLVPEFGSELADLLDAARNGDGDVQAIHKRALGTLSTYRRRLAGFDLLRQLEAVGALAGARPSLVSDYEDALQEIHETLSKAA